MVNAREWRFGYLLENFDEGLSDFVIGQALVR